METLQSFGITGIRPGGVAAFGSDAQLVVEFYRGKKLNGPASRDAGTSIYEPVDMVRIIQPGERDMAEYEAVEKYRRRFPQQWAAYQQGLEQRQAGTPLDLLYPDQPDVVATLNATRVHTIQQLANLSDTAIGNIPFGRKYVDQAKAYLGQATGSKEFHALKAENDSLRADVKDLKVLLEALRKQLEAEPEDASVVAPRRGPGRPRKEPAVTAPAHEGV